MTRTSLRRYRLFGGLQLSNCGGAVGTSSRAARSGLLPRYRGLGRGPALFFGVLEYLPGDIGGHFEDRAGKGEDYAWYADQVARIWHKWLSRRDSGGGSIGPGSLRS
jgi:hypothetical protein